MFNIVRLLILAYSGGRLPVPSSTKLVSGRLFDIAVALINDLHEAEIQLGHL